MTREILPFAVDIGRVRNEYKKTVLAVSTEEECTKVFPACRESLKYLRLRFKAFPGHFSTSKTTCDVSPVEEMTIAC